FTVTHNNVPSAGKATASPTEGEKNTNPATTDAKPNLHDELVDLPGIDVCLGHDIDLHPNSNFIFISDRQKGIIPAIKTVYPSAKHRYCLRLIHDNIKKGWYEQAYKDLLWRGAFATNVRDFKKCRAKSELLLNNIYEVFNGKIVGGRNKLLITLLKYIKEYCMKIIVNVQGVIDKCIVPLTPTTTRIMESIKKEAHLMKEQWNGVNKYQFSGSVVDQCVVDVVGRPRKKRKRSKHKDEPSAKDRQGGKETTGGNNVEASGSASGQAQQTKPVVGQDGSGWIMWLVIVIGLSATRKEEPLHCQSCGNIRHNTATCKGQGRRAITDGREMGDGVPTQSSAAGGASEWSFM
ncbi:hypothetical protein Tco_1347640, partial [Tanacetum coccineum]